MLKYSVVIVLFVFFINFGYCGYENNLDVADTFLCDEYGVEEKSDWANQLSSPMECYNSVSPTITTETVFTSGTTVLYDCQGTESYSDTFIYRANANADGYVYENRPFYYNFDFDCENSDYYFYYVMWSVWDINADRTITTRPTIEVPGTSFFEYASDSKTFSPSLENPSETISRSVDSPYSIYKPFPKLPVEITERGFAPTSALSLHSYFDNTMSVSDSVVEEYTDLLCDGDLTCFLLPTTSGIRYADYDSIDSYPGFDYLWEADIDGSSSLSSPYTLESNMHACLLDWFEDESLPIIIRAQRTWETYNCVSGLCLDNSFTGYYYHYVLLGYNDDIDKYLVQSSAGDRHYWTAGKLYEYWGDNDFDGFYLFKNPNLDVKEKKIDLVHTSTGTVIPEGNAIVSGGSYHYEIDDVESEYYSFTENPLMQIDYVGTASVDYSAYTKESEEIIFDINDYADNKVDSNIYIKDKVEQSYTYFTHDIIDSSDFNLPTYKDIDPQIINPNTQLIDLSFGSNYPGNTECAILIDGDLKDSVTIDEYVYDHECQLDISSATYSPEDDVVVKVSSTNPDTGINKLYDMPLIEKINYGSQFTFLPQDIKCINSGYCEFPSIDIYKDLGSYNVGEYFYVLPSQISMEVFLSGSAEYFRSLANVPSGEPYTDGLYSTIDFNFDYEEKDSSSVIGCDESENCFTLANNDYIKYYLYQSYDNGLYTQYTNTQEIQSDITVYDAILNDDIQIANQFKQSTSDDIGTPIQEQSLYIPSSDPEAGPYNNNIYDKCTFSFDVDNNLPAAQFTDEKIWFDVNNNKEIDDISYTSSIVNMDGTGCDGDNCYQYMDISPDCFGDSTECDVQLPYETTGINKFYCNTYNQYFDTTVDVYSCYSDIGVQDTFDDFTSYYSHLKEYYDSSSCSSYDTQKPNFYYDGATYDYNLEEVKICREDEIIDQTGQFFCSKIGEVYLQCDPNDEQFDYDNDGVIMADDLCCGYDDNVDADEDGIPDGCDYNIDINLTIVNLCTNGVRDGGAPAYETDVDYGGECGNCTNGILDPLINEVYADYGGKCGNCTDANEVSKPENDYDYFRIENKTYPFDYNDCESLDVPQQAFPILMLTFIFFGVIAYVVLPILVPLLLFLWWLKRRRKKNKKNKKRSKRRSKR